MNNRFLKSNSREVLREPLAGGKRRQKAVKLARELPAERESL